MQVIFRYIYKQQQNGYATRTSPYGAKDLSKYGFGANLIDQMMHQTDIIFNHIPNHV